MIKEISQETADIIDMLLKDKGKLCVSVILSIHNQQSDQQTTHDYISKAVEEAITVILKKPPADAEHLVNSLRTSLPIIYFNKNHSGVGIYVSRNVLFFTTFPFPVIRKVTIGKRFELNELLYKKQYFFPYLVLHIDMENFHLYYGKEKQLKEIILNDLSLETEEKIQPSSSTFASSIVNKTSSIYFEKDKHVLANNSFENFLSGVDEVLNTYRNEAEIIILCGLKNITSAFLNHTQHINKVQSIINGSNEWFNKTDINKLAWNSIEMYVQKKMWEEISEFEEKNGEGFTEEGLYMVKQAVEEGRADKLLIEKDYSYRAYYKLKNKEHYDINEPPPVQTEVVNEIIDLILKDKGTVTFVERGMLNNYQGIAVITRD
jgi:hypothetical protein